ncbi:MAG: hypothetical protein ACK5YR_04705 [Pirellula sp.]|jgi:hypothetical protein
MLAFAFSCVILMFFGSYSRGIPDQLVKENNLRQVYLGLRNYEQWFGTLPSVNENIWRFGNLLDSVSVSWRCWVLESATALGFPLVDPLEIDYGTYMTPRSQELELKANIIQAGKLLFDFKGERIVMNPLVAGQAFSNLRDQDVLAFYWPYDSQSDWYDIENSFTMSGNRDITAPAFIVGIQANGQIHQLSVDEINSLLCLTE